ncbi:MAG TPA: hypothetical protein PLF81_17950, partial [Candidatus Anammoximicrobium sp.]|nr:hypothetical protein [Candidatus Anammoximicrobium sp.]
RWFSDAQIEQFVADGGIEAAAALVKPHRPKEAPVYDVDPPNYIRAQLPSGVDAKAPEAFAQGLTDYLQDVNAQMPIPRIPPNRVDGYLQRSSKSHADGR